MTKVIGVIGGGAAGYFGAINTAQANPNYKVILWEATHKPLTKVKISGGGRCNVTHACFDPRAFAKHYPRGEKELIGPLSRFGPLQLIDWFEKRGVTLKTESDGRMFPASNKSQTIIDLFGKEASDAKIELRFGEKIEEIIYAPGEFTLTAKSGRYEKVDRLLLATGSSPVAWNLLQALNIKVVAGVPSIFTFKIESAILKELSGVSFTNVKVSLEVGGNRFSQTGPVLITHWGLSGPAILKLSAFAAHELHKENYHGLLEIDLLPNLSQGTVQARISESRKTLTRKLVANERVDTSISKRFWQNFLAYCEIAEGKTWGELSHKESERICVNVKSLRLAVKGKGIFKEEFVTAGGVDRQEIDFRTMEAKKVKGLYFAGEVVDIDGITGGFNFQNAWTCSWIAAQHLAE